MGVRLTAQGGVLVSKSPLGVHEFRIPGATAYRIDDRIVFCSQDGDIMMIPWDEREIRDMMTDLLARGCLEVTPPAKVQEALRRRERTKALLDHRAVRIAGAVASLAIGGVFVRSSQPRSAVIAGALAVAGYEMLWGRREDRRDPRDPDIATSVATWAGGLMSLAALALVGVLLLPDVVGGVLLTVVAVFGAYWARTRQWPKDPAAGARQ